MNIERALAIDGWMSPSELRWLAEQAAAHERIAEIGSWMGRSSAAMCDHTNGKVWCIDTWMGSDEPAHDRILGGKDKEWLMGQFLVNAAPNAIPLRMTSVNAAEYFRRHGMSFDMIFIDGAHDTESVKADILAWRPLLEAGGLFCGHDYFTTVKEAVDELLVVHEAPDTTIWVMDDDR